MPQKLDVAPELCEFAEMHIALKFAPTNPEVRKLVSKEKARLQKAALKAQPSGRLARHALVGPDGALYLVRLTRGKASKSRKPRIVCRAKRVEWSAWTVGWANCERCAAEVRSAWQQDVPGKYLSTYGWNSLTPEQRENIAAREEDGTAYRRTS